MAERPSSDCWKCKLTPVRHEAFYVPLPVGANPSAMQEIYLCEECAEDLAYLLTDWEDE